MKKMIDITKLPHDLKECYEDAKKEYAQKGAFFLEEEYLIKTNEETGAYPKILSLVLSDAKAIKSDSDMALYALFVVRAMEMRKSFMENLSLFTFPDKYFFLPFICLIPSMTDTLEFLKSKNLPDDVIENTMGQYQACVFIYEERFDRKGLNKHYFDWLQHYVDCEILNIQRLRFEIYKLSDPVYVLEHKITKEKVLLFDGGKMNENGLLFSAPPESAEPFVATFSENADSYEGNVINAFGRCEKGTKTFKKSEYSLRLKPGDTLLSVHIPNTGEFNDAICVESYKRAYEVFETYFPELNVKGLHCHSWMLSSELLDILKAESNIIKFRGRYMCYPAETEGRDVFNFVFKLKFKTFEDMAEDTSLQRAIKKVYLSGNYIYEYGGLILKDTQN